jgi:prephenate dehydrogenase
MWRDIFLANRIRILELIEGYIRDLEAMAGMLSEGRADDLERLLRTYSSLRRELYAHTR